MKQRTIIYGLLIIATMMQSSSMICAAKGTTRSSYYLQKPPAQIDNLACNFYKLKEMNERYFELIINLAKENVALKHENNTLQRANKEQERTIKLLEKNQIIPYLATIIGFATGASIIAFNHHLYKSSNTN